MYKKVLDHKLLKPIDDYLLFSDQINTDTLLDDIDALFSSALADMSYNFDDIMITIKNIIHLVKFDSVMLNKLTVYKSDRPEEFDKSLTSAFIGVEIGKSLNFQEQDLVDLYCTCLLRDIGQIFVDPAIFTKSELTPQDYKAIMVHPVVSHLILKESKTNFSKQVLHGVLNHHERIDGSGYPQKLEGATVGLFERILGVVDSFEAMIRKNRTTEDALWVLKCNSANQTIAGEKVQSCYDQKIVEKLENLINIVEASECSEQQREALEMHVNKLFTSICAINDDITAILEELDIFIKSEATESANKVDSVFTKTQDNFHKLKHSVLNSSGLSDISFDMISGNADDLNATRKDIERIAPYLLTQLNFTKNKLANSDSATEKLQDLIKLSNVIYHKAFTLNRKVQQAV